MKRDEIERVFRFVFWGGLNTLIGFSVYCIFIFAGLHFSLASLLSLIVGIFIGHFFNKRHVFKSNKSDTIKIYFCIWFCLYFLNITIIYLLLDIGLGDYISGAVAAVFIVPFSYLFQKIFVFR